MTAIVIPTTLVDADSKIEVDQWEGCVHLDARSADEGQPSLLPEEARALAAVLIHQANEAEAER